MSFIDKSIIIVDLEGTITIDKWREHLRIVGEFDQYRSLFKDDLPNKNVINVINSLSSTHNIVILTAKPIEDKDDVVSWLHNNDVIYSKLMMRSKGDKSSSVELKRSALNYIRGQGYDVTLAIDDRSDIVDMFKAEGITCLRI